MEINQAAKFSMNNRKEVEKASLCGCYHCLETFSPNEITAWTDNNDTAICPKCNIDAVIPETDAKIDKDFLNKLKTYWF